MTLLQSMLSLCYGCPACACWHDNNCSLPTEEDGQACSLLVSVGHCSQYLLISYPWATAAVALSLQWLQVVRGQPEVLLV